jgi:hypothetical protein
MKRKRFYLFKGALLLFCLLCVGCHASESDIEMVKGSSPPTFELSGTGTVMQVLVYGPHNSLAELDKDLHDGKSTYLWELSSAERVLVEDISPFIYGQIPPGFTQTQPKSGQIPQLQEGKVYYILVYVVGASTVGHPFIIKNGKAEMAGNQHEANPAN